MLCFGSTCPTNKLPPPPTFSGTFPSGSAGKESTCNAGDPGSIPRLGRSPGEGTGYPLQYSGLENPMDYTVMGITESNKTEQLSLFTFPFIWESSYRSTGVSPK